MRQRWRLAEVKCEDYAFVLLSRCINKLEEEVRRAGAEAAGVFVGRGTGISAAGMNEVAGQRARPAAYGSFVRISRAY